MSEMSNRDRKVAFLLSLLQGKMEVSGLDARTLARRSGLSVGAAVSALQTAGIGVIAESAVESIPAPGASAPAVKVAKGTVSVPKAKKVVRPASGPATVKLGAQCPELGNLRWEVDPEVLAAARQVAVERELLRREEFKAELKRRMAASLAKTESRLPQRLAVARVVGFLLWVQAHREEIIFSLKEEERLAREHRLIELAQDAAHAAAIRFFPKGSSGYKAAYEAALRVGLKKAGL